MILKNCNCNSNWCLTSENPFLFKRYIAKDVCESVSLFFIDNSVIVEHNIIKKLSSTEGLGELLLSKKYDNSGKSIKMINDFLLGLGIKLKIESSDFRC